MRFYGTFFMSLDDKGRIAIPATERAKLAEFCGSRIVVTADLDNRLLVYPEPYFDDLAERLSQLPSKPATEALQRRLLGSASHAKLDAQGRVLLTPAQRVLGKLEKDAVLIGIGNRYQLWRRDLWEAQQERDRELAATALAEDPGLADFRL
ncbi:division/cell wall cluster transcriptional repressor MraZ [Thiohalocapsa sp. ML1]|jgi:MraZ protein|uniref:division/cell wall cluster transcriptional repressor MraZ n=1 Tax=Thiohalocapsa sp. ML1 TaxID=1431688 RepID=UPI0009E6DDE4|nr:division/cell wall cluster transcriptional repressor MraZ [Thiohalocapsa sp. ML1]